RSPAASAATAPSSTAKNRTSRRNSAPTACPQNSGSNGPRTNLNARSDVFVEAYASDPTTSVIPGLSSHESSVAGEAEFFFSLRLRRREHQSSDCFENKFNLLVVFAVFAFQIIKFPGEFRVRRNDFPQTHKRTHDGDVDFDGSNAVQHAGKHRHALFRKGIR